MVSYQEALVSVLDSKIQPLIQLKGKLSKLNQELKTLNSMKEDTEVKLRGLERPGRTRKGRVDKWLKDLELIMEKEQDVTNQINEIFSYESIDEVIEEVIKDVENHQSVEGQSDKRRNISESKAVVGVKKTILGIGGFGETTFNLNDSPITFQIENIQMIHDYESRQGNGANGERKA